MGGFDEFLMKHLSNVVSMNFSNCIKVDPEMFINSVVNSKQITHLAMNGCKQFSEYQLVKLLTSLPNLIVMEALNTTPCVSAKQVLNQCINIKVLEVVPKFPFAEAMKWIQLREQFPHIDFGKEIKKITLNE